MSHYQKKQDSWPNLHAHNVGGSLIRKFHMLSGVHKSLEFKSYFTVIETVSSIRMQTVALGD